MKIVINKCYGGFGLSFDAIVEYLKRKNKKAYFYIPVQNKNGEYSDTKCKKISLEKAKKETYLVYIYTKDFGKTIKNIDDENIDEYYFSYYNIQRDDPDLVHVVEKMGEKADGKCAQLKVVEIPDDIEWTIEEYDGVEWTAEKHRTWE